MKYRNLSAWQREQLKYEVAMSMGLKKIIGDDWGDITARNCGLLGKKLKKIIKG